MKKRKAELYEILSHKSPAGKDGADNSSLYPEPRQLNNFTRSHTGREIIFSLDGAFIIFVVILLLIGTSFFLGYRKGQSEAKASFIRNINPDVSEPVAGLKLVDSHTPPGSTIDIPQGKYSLRLLSLKRTEKNFRRLSDLREKLLTNSLISSSKLQVFIFDKGRGGVYSLAIGLFSKPEDEMVATLEDFFTKYSLNGKSREFKSVTLERVEDLGRAETGR